MMEAVLKKLEEHDVYFKNIIQHLNKIDERFVLVDERFDKTTKALSALNKQLARVGLQIAEINEKVNILQKNDLRTGVLLEATNHRLDQLIETQIFLMETRIRREEVESQLEHHDHRISALELTVRKKL